MERLLLETAGKFDESRFQVGYCNLFCLDEGNGAFPSALRDRGVPYFHVRGTGWADLPSMLLRLVDIVRRERVDVLHAHMLHATIAAAASARLGRVPVFAVTRHYLGSGYVNHGRWMRSLDFGVARSAMHVAAVSNAVREDLIREGGVSPSRVSVIHNGINLDVFDAAGSCPCPDVRRSDRDFVLGAVGSLNVYKGHADLLRALPAVLRVRPDARLVIVGDGPERSSLESLAAGLGIADRVSFVGFQRNVAGWMRSFDLYVHPSHDESFGISILEAMAARRAVVATSVGGIPEVVVDGETGLLVPPTDPERLACAILTLMRDRAIARDMGDRGRRRVEEQFSIPYVIERYQELYTTLQAGQG